MCYEPRRKVCNPRIISLRTNPNRVGCDVLRGRLSTVDDVPVKSKVPRRSIRSIMGDLLERGTRVGKQSRYLLECHVRTDIFSFREDQDQSLSYSPYISTRK
ncbi:hypothetical protein HYQ46_002681 [Verticillium longisporum]|nr:hypothetical protein HYQ46_002681 [Verticillium longisporum]